MSHANIYAACSQGSPLVAATLAFKDAARVNYQLGLADPNALTIELVFEDLSRLLIKGSCNAKAFAQREIDATFPPYDPRPVLAEIRSAAETGLADPSAGWSLRSLDEGENAFDPENYYSSVPGYSAMQSF